MFDKAKDMAITSSSKKSGTKKSASKKSASKNVKTSVKRGRAPGQATLQRQMAKMEEARAQYQAKIEANESRLRANAAAGGQPLTSEQTEMTQDILKRQREHLAALDAYERGKLDDDPRESPER